MAEEDRPDLLALAEEIEANEGPDGGAEDLVPNRTHVERTYSLKEVEYTAQHASATAYRTLAEVFEADYPDTLLTGTKVAEILREAAEKTQALADAAWTDPGAVS